MKKVNPEVARKLGEATLHYSNERYEEVCHLICHCLIYILFETRPQILI